MSLINPFNVVVIATDGASGFASRTLPVVVEGAPNEPPVLTAGFSASEGVAPIPLSLSIDATDPSPAVGGACHERPSSAPGLRTA